MAFKKDNTWVLNVAILTLALSPPFVQSSSSGLPYGTNMAPNRATTRSISTEVERFGNEASARRVDVGDSARQVPTGPNPLHHNNNPLGP